MKVLFATLEYYPLIPGGIGTGVRTLARALTAAGVQCSVAIPLPGWNSRQPFEDGSVRVHRVPIPSWAQGRLKVARYELSPGFVLKRLALWRWLSRFALRRDFDIIETHEWSGPLLAKPHPWLVVRLHGGHAAHSYYEGRRASRLLRWLERKNVKMADAVVAVSAHTGKLTMDALRLKRRFSVVYNGVDTEFFKPVPVEREPFQVLYVGSLVRRKGVLNLLRAVPLVLKTIRDVRFRFVGPIPAGGTARWELESVLEGLPAEAKSHIEFSGRLPHEGLPEVFSKAALAVFPSFAEAFGLVVAEAMACETPVVVTNLASGPELVEDGVSGVLANPHSVEDLAEKIVMLLKDDRLRALLGRAGRKRAEKRFSIHSVVEDNMQIYNSLVGLGSGS
jgi:glycosyltransferase involved in cell wall biosynthesis